MRRRDNIYLGVILILIGLVLFLYFKPSSSNEVITTKTDTLVVNNTKTIYKNRLVPIGVDSFKVITDTITIPDSLMKQAYAKLLVKYRTTKHYKDTIYSDSLNTVILAEQCDSNTISNRVVDVSIKNKIITNTTTIERNNYYNGFGIGAIVDANTITPSIVYTNKNFVYLGGYDVVNKNVRIGLFYKFNFKK